MQIEERIETLIVPVLDEMGYALVRVQITSASSPVLQVMAERSDGGGITVDECAQISREVSTILDMEDPIALSYELEVSSPGIDRPLVKLADFERFTGFDVRIELHEAQAGRRKFRGRLKHVSGDTICVQCREGLVDLPHAGIRRAKLILSDKLLAATAGRKH
ncbi:MAG: ribosome maturation factor RimP [Pseudomonadota bacterium]|nr:ribosome maturation factor RimP [Pseudomonadota bacterium]